MYGRACEALHFMDMRARAMKEALALLSCGADGTLRLWNARMGKLIFGVPDVCAPGESATAMCAEETNTFVITPDSAGRVKVWDVSRRSAPRAHDHGGAVDADGDGLFDEIDDDDPYGLKPKVARDGEDPSGQGVAARGGRTRSRSRARRVPQRDRGDPQRAVDAHRARARSPASRWGCSVRRRRGRSSA